MLTPDEFSTWPTAQLEAESIRLRQEIADLSRAGQINAELQKTLQAIEAILAEKILDRDIVRPAKSHQVHIDKSDVVNAGQLLNDLSEAERDGILVRGRAYWAMANIQRGKLTNDKTIGQISFVNAYALTEKYFTTDQAGGAAAMIDVIALTQQWKVSNNGAYERALAESYSAVYTMSGTSDLHPSSVSFIQLVQNFVLHLRHRVFNRFRFEKFTHNSRMDIVHATALHLHKTAADLRKVHPIIGFNPALRDPFLESSLYMLLRDSCDDTPDLANSMRELLRVLEAQSNDIQLHPIETPADWDEPIQGSELEKELQTAVPIVHTHLIQILRAALDEPRVIANAARNINDSVVLFNEMPTHLPTIDEIIQEKSALNLAVLSHGRRTILSVDQEERLMEIRLQGDDSIRVHPDGRILHQNAPYLVVESELSHLKDGADKFRQNIGSLYASVEEILDASCPSLRLLPVDVQSSTVVVQRRGDLILLFPSEVISLLPEVANLNACSEFDVKEMTDAIDPRMEELGSWNACVLPTVNALADEYFNRVQIDGDFVQGHEPRDSNENGSGTGGRAIEMLPRLRVIRNVLLQTRSADRPVEFAWGQHVHQSFSDVDEGTYTIVTVHDGLQFVVSDEGNRGAYVLMQPLKYEILKTQPIAPAWLQRQGGRFMAFRSPRQFGAVIQQALDERDMLLGLQGYENIEAMVAAERLELMRLFDRVARFRQEQSPDQRKKNPLSLIAEDFRQITSGSCGLYCGETVLNHLMAKCNLKISNVVMLEMVQSALRGANE